MSSTQQNQGGGRSGGRNSTEYRGRGGGNRGRGRGGQDRGGGSGSSYQPGQAPYSSQGKDRGGKQYRGGGQERGGGRGGQERGGGRGGRGKRDREARDLDESAKKNDRNSQLNKANEGNALDQFDKLFGGESGGAQKAEESKDAGDGNADQLMDMLGVGKEPNAEEDDDAIIIEDDAAIIVEDKEPEADAKEPADYTEDDIAIINAAKQSQPLWKETERTKYSPSEMLAAFAEEKDINFDLFDKDYFSVREVFSLHNQLPFNQEKELIKQVDVRRFQEKPGGASLAQKRYQT